jgi:hypothetical protein
VPKARIRHLVSRQPTPRLIHEVSALLRRVISRPPGSPAGNRARAEVEHRLMQVLVARGLTAVSRVVAGLTLPGCILHQTASTGETRAWQALPAADRELTIRVSRNRFYRVVSVQHRRLWKAELTRHRRAIAALQREFYDRYTAAGRVAYATPPGRLPPSERQILLIGEFEADINNGGFLQYLDNKGRRRAAAARGILIRIGANRTAALLGEALAPGTSEDRLRELDGLFDRTREDLAVLTIRAVGSRERESGTRSRGSR